MLLKMTLSACVVLAVLALALLFHVVRLRRELNRTRVEQSHIQALVDSIPDLTWVKDRESRFLMVNRQFLRVFGLPLEEILGKTDEHLSEPEMAKRYLADDRLVMNTREVLHREERVASPGGHEAWAETVKVPVIGPNNEVVGTAGIARDISERKKNERQMRHLAHHDALTNLPNRVLLELRFKHCLTHHDPEVDALVVMFIDLDNFKIINDTVSHSIGDLVLIELANRLRSIARKDDIIARIGGDEFVVVLPYTRVDQAHGYLERLQHTLTQPISIESMSFETTMSIGISRFPQDGHDCWSLIQNADLAMYHAKQTGKNQAAVFSQYLADRSIQKMTLDSRIEEALTRHEFEIYYQPKVAVPSWKIVGLEALIRWNDKVSGEILLPDEFIPSAERSGLILKLGDWLINETLQQLAAWRLEGINIPVSINISAVQMHQNRIVDNIKRGLSRHGLPGHMLELELTESVVMENSDKIIRNLESIRDQGITISIDDFGTGYSNLAYLSRFPLNSLKIDRVFVQNIHLDKHNFQVASAIVEMAKSMELSVVAEGVECKEELLALQRLGVDQVQGYFFDRALPVGKLKSRLHPDWRYDPNLGHKPKLS